MFAMFHRLRRRFGFAGQASRPPARRPQVRLSLETLDDRIVPTTNPFSTAAFTTNSLVANYATLLQVNPLITQTFFQIDPTPQLAATGTNAFTSTINLGLGTLKVQSQAYNTAGIWNFAGTFESMTQIPLFGFLVSDDIGPLSFASGQIHSSPASSGTGVFNGSTVSYFTNIISFQAVGDGMVGDPSLGAMDHQQVTFNGSILSVWFNGTAVPVGVSGTVDIKDTVSIPGFGPMTFDTSEVVPGTTMWLGTNWASITH
jgi:hypothetical protein